MASPSFVPALAGVLLLASFGSAQQVSRDLYYSHLPPLPPRVGQTSASVRFSLYGDTAAPDYRDVAPVDGIDDARACILLRLAARFSPILRRNNFSGPQDFREAMGGRPVLHVDTWSMGRRVASDSVLLYRSSGENGGAAEAVRSDSVLEVLVRELHPDVGEPRSVPAEAPVERVLFFDFPGEDERSWREAYRDQRESRIYAHLFITGDSSAGGEPRYDLAIQYWFFYPFNDGPNDHEGDWEHLVVLPTTLERAGELPGAGRMTAEDVRRVLADELPTDSLVIRAVEYYFHESVMVVDYLPARSVTPHGRWQELLHLHVWEQPDFVADAVARRLHVYGGRLANHPIGYIGGNSKGPDELLAIRPRFGGSYNRNPHGTYPFPGTWQGIGPLGSTEAVAGRLVPRLAEDCDSMAGAPLSFADRHFISYEEADIQLLPDWERLKDLVLDDPDVRREWSWILLPIRWGYPATASLGAGAISHVDVGQVAPEFPAFQPTWNRLAGANGFHVFDPRVLRVMLVPVTPWDRIQNGWGVLNLPRILLGFLPGWSVVVTQLAPWLSVPLEAVGMNTGRTFAPARRVSRFSTTTVGGFWQSGGVDFARLLPAPDHVGVTQLANRLSAETLEETSLRRTGTDGIRGSLEIHFGPRFSVLNAYSRSRSNVDYRLGMAAGKPVRVHGELDMKELLGGFRYRFGAPEAMTRTFVGGGWGWTWYHVDHVTVGDSALDYRQDGGYAVTLGPSRQWWPNTWYASAGVEVLAPRQAWLFDRIGYGLELKATGVLHRLGARDPGQHSPGSVGRRELNIGVVTTW